MAAPEEEIAELVASVVAPLIDNLDSMEVTADLNGDNLLIEVSVDDADTGKVIGRQGRVIKSIRVLARAAASRKGLNVDVEIVD